MKEKEEQLKRAIVLRKVTNNPSMPIYQDGVYSFKAEFAAQEASVEGCPLYVYHAGYKIEIPYGYIGLLMAADTVASSSLAAATDVRVLKPGQEHDLFLAFKLTTNASPAMFKIHDYGQEATMTEEARPEEEGSVFCNLLLIENTAVGIDIVGETNYEGGGMSELVNGAGAQQEVIKELHEIEPTTDATKVTLSEDIIENVEAPSLEEVLTTGYDMEIEAPALENIGTLIISE